jgi:hypothetical protein
MERYLTTKGLFLRCIEEGKFILEDVFGICTLPFCAENVELASKVAFDAARVRVLCNESESGEMPSFSSFRWFELEKYYVARLTDHFRYWQVGAQLVPTFDMLSHVLPTPYFEYGFGEGAKDDLEEIDKLINSKAEAGEAPFTKQYVAIKLAHMQLQRICSDLMSLVNRAISAYVELLLIQRATIKEEYWSAAHMNASEIVHTGPKSYKAATSVTICVISLCSSLDISTKLVNFLNGCQRPLDRFRSAQGKHFSDLPKIRPSSLSLEHVHEIVNLGENEKEFPSLIQLRHDLIHSTTVLEMEKIYVGYQTGEVNGVPFHYSYMPWRDCSETGQPLRYLGRDYFTAGGVDIEWQLLIWIEAVVRYHLAVGATLYEFLTSRTIADTGVKLLPTR